MLQTKPWLESLDTPALAILPPEQTEKMGKQENEIRALSLRIDELESRLRSVEGLVMKTKALKTAIHHIIHAWPGPFTAQQIRDTLYELHPDLKPMEKSHTIESKITMLAKQGLILRTFQGQGPHASIYELSKNPPARASRPGAKLGSKHQYESGFRAVVRQALEDFPVRFTLVDLKKWVTENLPNLRVPEGSWSSTLYKLCQLGELKVMKFGHRGASLKEYQRTSKRVAASGAELRELEASWREFRASLNIKLPEIHLSDPARADIE